ncbi:MAG: hypothetical protein ACTSSJ_04895 [Candidatus Odinarchaeia archaeon]
MVNRAEHLLWGSFIFAIYYLIFDFFLKLLYIPLWVGAIIGFTGAYFPDFDLELGVRFHRSPISHSAIIPVMFFATYLYFTLTATMEAVVLNLLAVFFLTYSTHLFADLLPSKRGFLKRFQTILSTSTPGDIRGVPEKLEKPWLIVSGAICLGLTIVFNLIVIGVI